MLSKPEEQLVDINITISDIFYEFNLSWKKYLTILMATLIISGLMQLVIVKESKIEFEVLLKQPNEFPIDSDSFIKRSVIYLLEDIKLAKAGVKIKKNKNKLRMIFSINEKNNTDSLTRMLNDSLYQIMKRHEVAAIENERIFNETTPYAYSWKSILKAYELSLITQSLAKLDSVAVIINKSLVKTKIPVMTMILVGLIFGATVCFIFAINATFNRKKPSFK